METHSVPVVADDFGRLRFTPSHLLDPYPLYARLREQPGITFSSSLGLWLVSRYRDVMTVLRTPMQFSSGMALRAPQARPPEIQAILDEGGYTPRLPLLTDDPPNHGAMRSLVVKAFTPARVAALEPRIQGWLDKLLDECGDDGPGDPVAQLAVPLPMRVMCELIGVPDEDVQRVKEYCEAAAVFATGRMPPDQMAACAHAVVAYRRYVRQLVENEQQRPGGNLINALLAVRDQDPEFAPINHEEVVGLCIVFIFAGHQTTTGLLSNALLHLLPRPELWAALADDADLCARAVEEVLRYDAPVQGMMRTNVSPTVLSGTELPAQARLLLVFGAANRDETVFPEPDQFDITRKNIDQHMSLGRGIHFCIGASLARLEARLLLQSLSRRYPKARLVEGAPLEYSPNLIQRSPSRLQVQWR